MKKIALVVMILLLGYSVSVGAYELSWWYVGHRVYEDGRDYNLMVFGVLDDMGKLPTSDVLTSTTLLDPLGQEVALTNLRFYYDPLYITGQYKNGEFIYSDTTPDSGYVAEVEGVLMEGTYTLELKDITGATLTGTYEFNGFLQIPMISFSSIGASKDESGNLILYWDLPDEWYGTQTNTVGILDAYANGEVTGEVWVRVPNNIEYVSIPESVIQEVKTWGDQFKFRVLFRTNDSNNRNYSREVDVDLDNALIAHFGDVPFSYWSYENIEKLLESGITTGCGDGNYCPGDTVTRAQMAVFLERGLQGSDFTPPAASGVFEDVALDYWAAAWIEQFYQDGITKGCDTDPLSYCPEQQVTRAEMAIFLLRAKYGSSYSPPTATGVFSDVSSGYWAADWIEQLYAEGITTGCGDSPLRFCPDDSVTRDQMAAFLVRTFGL